MAFDRAKYWKEYREKNKGKWPLKRTPIVKKAVKISKVKSLPKRKQNKDKSLSELVDIAEYRFNARAKERDTDMFGMISCISCNIRYKASMMHAGHFLPAGNNGIIRFHEHNVNGQCPICNLNKHGNQKAYRVGLIKKIGLEAVEELELLAKQPFKWDREYLIEIIEKYKESRLKSA